MSMMFKTYSSGRSSLLVVFKLSLRMDRATAGTSESKDPESFCEQKPREILRAKTQRIFPKESRSIQFARIELSSSISEGLNGQPSAVLEK
jgi:hypothetical protein